MEGGRGRAYRLCGRNGDIVERAVRARGAADCLQEFGPAMRVIVGPRAHVNAIDFCRASGAYAPIKSHGGKDRRAPEVLKIRVSHRPAAEIWSGRIEHLAANVNDHRNQEYFDVRRGVSCRKWVLPHDHIGVLSTILAGREGKSTQRDGCSFANRGHCGHRVLMAPRVRNNYGVAPQRGRQGLGMHLTVARRQGE
jgi:hypothetical protein